MTKILIVDEDVLFREALAAVLSRDASLDAEVICSSGEPSSVLNSSSPADVVLVSSHAADGTFAHACRALSQDSVVLALSKSDHEQTLLRCLESGGEGTITFDSDCATLVGSIHAALRGEACVPRGMLGGLLHQLIARRRVASEVQKRFERLTQRERQVLAGLAAGQDVDALAVSLIISPQTVRSHCQRVLDKLEVHSRSEAVSVVLDHQLLDTS